jgi:hypothetical protein
MQKYHEKVKRRAIAKTQQQENYHRIHWGSPETILSALPDACHLRAFTGPSCRAVQLTGHYRF